MAFLHAHMPRPVLHHDLKTDNVLVWSEEGAGFRAKLTDFGLATGTSLSTMRTTMRGGSHAGTFAYKAPECCAPTADRTRDLLAPHTAHIIAT